MKSVFNFIITPKDSRSTSVKKINNKSLILNTDLQNHEFVSRHAVVVSVPLIGNTEIKEGDEVIVHHNIMRRFYDVRGNEKWSGSYFQDNLWFAQFDQIYAYKKNGKWRATDGYCFVAPLENSSMYSIEKEQPAIGALVFIDKTLENQGLAEGSIVGFRPGLEYEFIIEGKKLYRIPTKFITIEYGRKGNEKEYNPSWAKSS